MRTEAAGKSIKIAEVFSDNQSGDGTLTSGAIDRQGFDAARVAVNVEAPTGSPTALTATLIVTHADTSGGSYTTFATVDTASDVLAGATLEDAVNLREAKRYIKIQSALAFTGGSTPAADAALVCVLAGADELPVT